MEIIKKIDQPKKQSPTFIAGSLYYEVLLREIIVNIIRSRWTRNYDGMVGLLKQGFIITRPFMNDTNAINSIQTKIASVEYKLQNWKRIQKNRQASHSTMLMAEDNICAEIEQAQAEWAMNIKDLMLKTDFQQELDMDKFVNGDN